MQNARREMIQKEKYYQAISQINKAPEYKLLQSLTPIK